MLTPQFTLLDVAIHVIVLFNLRSIGECYGYHLGKEFNLPRTMQIKIL